VEALAHVPDDDGLRRLRSCTIPGEVLRAARRRRGSRSARRRAGRAARAPRAGAVKMPLGIDLDTHGGELAHAVRARAARRVRDEPVRDPAGFGGGERPRRRPDEPLVLVDGALEVHEERAERRESGRVMRGKSSSRRASGRLRAVLAAACASSARAAGGRAPVAAGRPRSRARSSGRCEVLLLVLDRRRRA